MKHEIRIIGGHWKRTKLKVPDKPGLRPTPDRVRETLFNWLGHDLTGWRCIDVFAGTGALGLEAASRGASHVHLVEQDTTLIDNLQRIKTQLNAAAVKVQRGNGLAALQQQTAGTCDLIFLDPPFDANLFAPALQLCANALSVKGWVYLEAPTLWTNDQLQAYHLAVHRHLKAGAVHAHLLQPLIATQP